MTLTDFVLFLSGFLVPSPAVWIWRRILGTDYRRVAYDHYRLRAATKKAVHAAKDPVSCSDGDCSKI